MCKHSSHTSLKKGEVLRRASFFFFVESILWETLALSEVFMETTCFFQKKSVLRFWLGEHQSVVLDDRLLWVGLFGVNEAFGANETFVNVAANVNVTTNVDEKINQID